LNSAVAYQPVGASRGMPPESHLEMPPQDLRYKPSRRRRDRSTPAVLYARFILIATTLGVSTYGIYQMLQVVRFASMTVLQGLMISFFAVSLGWIAFAAGSVLAGASKRRDPLPPTLPENSLTALVMPIYNEDPVRTTSALQAMAEALKDIGANHRFEIVVLSDSTDADSWIRETAAIHVLRMSLTSVMPVWYRRRWKNVARKSGNLEDFVTRWGGRYDHMIVLDADSLIDAPTLLRLVQVMQADSTLGILQTAPQLIGARTFFGRLQQFAACVYGPVITRGLAAWSGDSCNYWGHNAIIRMRAFAENCGLPTLKGRKPFGGHVLSHDFVEAALMRRGGWKVRMATDCGGSWEESPPSLIDVAIRDRRWAQGNLQHMKIIGASGLSFTSRLHLGIGIMSYLSSPLWLLMLGIGFALAVQSHLIRPEYFNHDFQLFPTWPRFDVELMMALFWFSMLVLLIPKMLGLVRALLSARIRRGGGGLIGGIACAVKEKSPGVRIIGVQPARLPSMKAAIAEGKPVTLKPAATIADGIAVRRAGDRTFPLVQKYVDDIVTVDEEEIANAILLLLEREKTLAEGAGAAALAALVNRKLSLVGKKVAVLVCGGNIDVTLLSRIIERGLVKDGRLVRLRVHLPDYPGALNLLTSILAQHRANIVETDYDRAYHGVGLGETAIEITMETRGPDHIAEIISALGAAGYAQERVL